MANATRAAVIGMAQHIVGMNIEEAQKAGYSIGLSDVQALAREFLALREEKVQVAGLFENGPSGQGIVEMPSSPPPTDTEVRLAALRTAAETYNTGIGVYGPPDDVVAMAFVYRAFLQGGQDAELLQRATREDGGTGLHKLVLGDQ